MLLSRFTRDEGLSMLRKGSNRLAGWLVVLALLAAVLVAWQAPAQAPDEPLSVADNSPHVPLKCLGVSSCTAAACHNAGGPDGSKRSEYTTWFQHDRHAHAFAVLGGKQSEIIARNLAAGGKIVPAKENTLCLKCHALAPELAGKKHAYVNDDGVSCESCHGRAEKWLSIHYLPEWQQKSDDDKLRYGMTPTKNLVYRARQCAECHIGTPDKEVNHDLYAAGHPPLYYEFSSFLASMPKHWSEREDKARYPDLELRAWVLGQAVSAEAAMKLLVHRASSETSPWPEFAEYNCYACHHVLSAKSQRQRFGHIPVPGTLPFNFWFTSLLPVPLESQFSGRVASQVKQEIDDLREAMQRPTPRRKAVAEQADILKRRLQELLPRLEKSVHTQPIAEMIISSFFAQGRKRSASSWEEDMQIYLGLTAAFRTMRDLDPAYRDGSLRQRLNNLQNRLRSPEGYDGSPVHSSEDSKESPKRP